jgi:hypothetical protein
MLSVIGFPRPTHNRYSPTCAFVAFLCLWAFLRFSETNPHKGDASLGFNPATLAELFGEEPVPSATVLRMGTRYLAACKEWRIGGALALVLVKMVEQGQGQERAE